MRKEDYMSPPDGKVPGDDATCSHDRCGKCEGNHCKKCGDECNGCSNSCLCDPCPPGGENYCLELGRMEFFMLDDTGNPPGVPSWGSGSYAHEFAFWHKCNKYHGAFKLYGIAAPAGTPFEVPAYWISSSDTPEATVTGKILDPCFTVHLPGGDVTVECDKLIPSEPFTWRVEATSTCGAYD